MRLLRISLAGAALALLGAPAAAQTNTAHVGQPFGNQGHGCDNPGVPDDSGPGLVAADLVCSGDTGFGHGKANAEAGKVYALSEAVHYSISFGDEIIASASATDYVTFTGPGASVAVSFNVVVSGSETSKYGSWALINGLATLNGAGASFERNTNYLGGEPICFTDFVDGKGCGGMIGPQFLTTGTVVVPTNTPIALLLQLSLRTAAQSFDDSRAEYEMRLASDVDLASFGKTGVFNLADGFSANTLSGSIVDNHYIFAAPPSPEGVPEPASWAMMLAGFGAMGAGMRSRRKARFAA